MDVKELLTPQVLQNALAIMQRAAMTGNEAYVYVQTVEIFKQAIRAMQTPQESKEAKDGDNREAVNESRPKSAARK